MRYIREMELGLDLNLLRTFVVVYRARSITGAAKELHVSQPAVSHSLKRLRTHFDDQLFLRTSGGVLPTPFATHLYEEVSAPLSQIADLTNERTRFEPAISKRSFSLALTDIGEAALLPRILRAVTRAAPDVRIESHRIDIDTVAEDVVTGRVDAAIASSLVPATVNQEVLFHDRYGCIVPGDLGDDDGVARIEDLRQLREVRVDHSVGHNAIADAITNLGPTVFSPVPHVQVQGFASLPRIVANGRYAGIVPIGALRELTKLDDTRILDLPCESPERAVRLLSHRIHATSGYSAHRWFLDTIRGALRDLYRDELGLA